MWKSAVTLLMLLGPALLFVAAFTYESREIYRTIVAERSRRDGRRG